MTDLIPAGIASAAELRAAIAHYGRNDPDPGVVAEKILANLTDVEAHIVAAATLRDYVRHVLVRPTIANATATYQTSSGQKTASAATAAMIDWYTAELATSMHVGDAWKRLGDCGVKDLEHIVSSRRAKARDVLAEADRYQALLAAVKKAKVSTVSALDPAVGRELLKR